MPPQNQNPGLGNPSGPAPANPNDPARYEFFMNPEKPKKPRLGFGGSGDNFLLKIGLIVGGGVILMIILGIAASALGGGNDNLPRLLKVAQDQNEIVRISTLAGYNAQQTSSKNFALTAQLGVASAQQQLLSYLNAHGTKFAPKQLALSKNPQNDQTLAVAKSASTYDDAYFTIMQGLISNYLNDLKTTFDNTKTTALRQLLNSEYVGAQALNNQLTAQQQDQ